MQRCSAAHGLHTGDREDGKVLVHTPAPLNQKMWLMGHHYCLRPLASLHAICQKGNSSFNFTGVVETSDLLLVKMRILFYIGRNLKLFL